MAEVAQRNDTTYYTCGACGFAYLEERWAKACEEFCTQHHGCSIEITEHAVEMPEEQGGNGRRQ
jgi:hypothetical protein